ncbi:MAG: hypothetical protein LUO94_01460 [Methylococcaceae bacterium]|nr:hypothetical protein [Methylococcaceae bacterium]OYV21040.1 MAG: Uncharacterized protein CG441_171 [Methylococcaceae bacterium NSM2-1]
MSDYRCISPGSHYGSVGIGRRCGRKIGVCTRCNDTTRQSTFFVEELVRLGILPTGSDSLLDQMRKLRNQASHLPDFSFNQGEADRYLQLAARMSELILNVE